MGKTGKRPSYEYSASRQLLCSGLIASMWMHYAQTGKIDPPKFLSAQSIYIPAHGFPESPPVAFGIHNTVQCAEVQSSRPWEADEEAGRYITAASISPPAKEYYAASSETEAVCLSVDSFVSLA